MKYRKIVLLLLALAASQACAEQTVTDWQREAVRAYPALASKDSDFNRLFVSEYSRLKQENAAFFSDPQWPMLLARQCAEKLKPKESLDAAPSPVSPAASTEPDKPKRIKVECRLLEIPFQQADEVEAILQRCGPNPSQQTHQLDGILWGTGARKLGELIGSSPPGEHYKNGNLEFNGGMRPNAACDLSLTFSFSDVSRDTHTLKSSCTFRARNGLPVVLTRIDLGDQAGIVVARCSWDPNGEGSASGSDQHETPDSSGAGENAGVESSTVRMECSLVELPSRLADAVESILLRWIANPSEQARQVDAVLSGAGVKRIATLTCAGKSNERRVIVNLGKPVNRVPLGANAATWGAYPRGVGDTFECEPTVGLDNSTCDLNCTFDRTPEHDGPYKFETVTSMSSVTSFNGLPMVLARRDFGSAAELVIVKAGVGLLPRRCVPRADAACPRWCMCAQGW